LSFRYCASSFRPISSLSLSVMTASATILRPAATSTGSVDDNASLVVSASPVRKGWAGTRVARTAEWERVRGASAHRLHRFLLSDHADNTRALLSARGDVLCERHALRIHDGRLIAERWRPLTFDLPDRKHDRYRCQDCYGSPLSVKRGLTRILHGCG
jgi:hypothetical protein